MRILKTFIQDSPRLAPFWIMLYLINLGFSIGWIILHTVLVKRIGIAYLPYSYIIMSLFAIAGGSLYLIFADHVQRHKLMIWTVLLTVFCLVASRLFLLAPFAGEAELTWNRVFFIFLIFLAQGFCSFTLNMQAWTMIGDILTPHQGKQYYPLFGIGVLLGGISGGGVVPLILNVISIENLVLIWAAVLLLIIPAAYKFPRICEHKSKKTQIDLSPLSSHSFMQNLKEGLHYTRKSPVAKLLFGVAICFCILNAWQDFQYTQIMNEFFKSEKSLASFYGYYWIAFNFTAIIFQLVATERIIRSIGVINSLLVLPLILMINFILLMIHYGFLEGLWMRYSWDTVGMAIQGTAYQLSFNAIATRYRGRVRAWIEGLINPIGAILAGSLLISIQFVIGSNAQALWDYYYVFTLIGIVFTIIWMGWILWNKSAYLRSLKQNIDKEDIQTKIDAIESLEEKRDYICYEMVVDVLQDRSIHVHTNEQLNKIKVTALQVLGRLGYPKSIGAILPFMQDKSSDIRLEAIKTIACFKKVFAYPLVYDYLRHQLPHLFFHDKSKKVRIEAGRFLIQHYSKEEMLNFIDRVLEGTAPQKIMIIKILSHIDLDFHELVWHQLASDKNLEVRGEAIVRLWHQNEWRAQAEIALEQLLFSPKIEEKEMGLSILLRIGSPSHQKKNLLESRPDEILLKDHLSYQLLFSLTHLTYLDKNDALKAKLIDHIISILINSHYSAKERIKFLRLLPFVQEELSNDLFRDLLSLPENELKMASLQMHQLPNFVSEFLEENDFLTNSG